MVDTGNGMNSDTLENAFLVIGTPTKLYSKSEDNDLILGEKGIGRLSMMRLGNRAYVESGVSGEAYCQAVDFDWLEFNDPEKYIDDIEIDIIEESSAKESKQKGTRVTITSLNSFWDINKSTEFAQTFLRRLQHPFDKHKRIYPVNFFFNDVQIGSPPIRKWFKESANFYVEIYFDPFVKTDDEVVLTRHLKWQDSDVFEKREWKRKDLLIELEEFSENDLTSLGSFDVKALWFNRANIKSHSVDGKVNTVKEELNKWCGGYAIYRDGFRIGLTGSMEDDWLKMDSKALRSQGYAFNRYQTVGALSITSEHNPSLIDASNRESLISCEAFDTLKCIVSDVINKDLKSHISTVKEVTSKIKISEHTTENAISKSKSNLKRTITAVNDLKKRVGSGFKKDLEDIGVSIKTHLEDVQNLEKAVSLARDQRVELLELAGMGLVVDQVVHDLARLTERANEYLNEIEEVDHSEETAKIIKVLKDQLKTTNKRIRTVDKLSPSGRNKKEGFDIVEFSHEVLTGYKSRFERHDIEASVALDGSTAQRGLRITMVRGLVAQIIENLLDNSLFWLKVGLKDGESKRRIMIDIDSQSKTLSFCDSGPGIDPAYVNDITRPYFSTKPNGKGLGLFIIKELSDYHKINFYIDTLPDDDGKLRNFVLELP
ncbi:ATP-binding protein [Pontibacter sp. JAM-7]|uniref:ATP-binding protein n=1 Tax=Pontibacter sp. JAM-7 TaxID=3366581 RepID=UPI003AF80BD7